MGYYRIKIFGIVQGVGFRPFVARLFAGERGSVKNCGSYVEVLLATDGERAGRSGKKGMAGTIGSSGTLPPSENFAGLLSERIRESAPERAEIVDISVEELSGGDYFSMLKEDLPARGEEGKAFFIAESKRRSAEALAEEPLFIPPDLATCEDCERELFSPSDRRYLHPFINCTQCGPRLTIIERLPYDRIRTSMKGFEMCDQCRAEYTAPEDRRYDAQPICCHDCGPEVFFWEKSQDGDSKIENKSGENTFSQTSRGAYAITRARQALIDGEIVAVKGIGGFHLYCDATSDEAVRKLRTRKGRPAKPFAVMARDLETVRQVSVIECQGQEELLSGHRKPIVLLPKRGSKRAGSGKEPGILLSEYIAPGNDRLGLMLPYAPLQLLLFSYPDGLDEKMPQVLVATSANRSGGVICRSEEEVRESLGGVCGCILSHDREILTRADDSVVSFFEEKPYLVRRSRGYAPLPVTIQGLPEKLREGFDVLAFGGELKNTFCIGKGKLMYPSSYIGDLGQVKSEEALSETVGRFLEMLGAHPAVVVCDKHPGYRSRALAMEYVKSHPGIRLVEVQHHFAHVLSVMAQEHYYGQVIGVAYDGTGYGDDGTIWGGELFLCDTSGYERRAHISPFVFSGGDLAAREGFRVALSFLFDKYEKDSDIYDIISLLGLCDSKFVRPLRSMHDLGINSVRSTSCGRLFDAVSAVLGICKSSSFEGEAAMGLQTAAERYLRTVSPKSAGSAGANETATDCLGFSEDGSIDTAGLFYRIVERRCQGDDSGSLAYFFHRQLAHLTAEAAERIREQAGCGVVALSGGCFLNTLLLSLTKEALRKKGFTVLTAHEVPSNDSGISLGQCLAGMLL